mgnify:CR=1 FL=1
MTKSPEQIASRRKRKNAVFRAWYANNRRSCLAKAKEYREKNRDKVLEWKRVYAKNHRAGINAKQRNRRRANPMPHREEVAKWQAQNLATVRGYKRRWKVTHREAVRRADARSRQKCSPGYVRKTLIRAGWRRFIVIPKQIIEVQSIRLRVHRLAKEKKYGSRSGSQEYR